MHNHSSDEELIGRIDTSHARISRAQRDLFALIVEADRFGVWEGSGARDLGHWLCMRQGISEWKAHRLIAAAHARERLPRISEAFSSGELGIDPRWSSSPGSPRPRPAGLVRWANTVSGAHIRHVADLALRREISETREDENHRNLSWDLSDEGRRFDMQTQVPACHGAVIATAIERQMAELPVMPGGRTRTTSRPGGRTRWSRSARSGSPPTPIPIGPRSSCTRSWTGSSRARGAPSSSLVR